MMACLAMYSTCSTHPCDRVCDEKDLSKICNYDFTVTMSQTMFKKRGCGGCPENMTDCYDPKCITGDGHERPVYLVNGIFPGPSITVCEGDQIVVNVTNDMISAESLTLHWHGIYHNGTPFMDGTPMITQCPIPVGTTFQYRFMAEPAGTKFWHAHTSFHRADGIVGPLIIRHKVKKATAKDDSYLKSNRIPYYKNYVNKRSVREMTSNNRVHKKRLSTHSLADPYDFFGNLNRDRNNVLIVQEWKHQPSPIHYINDNEEAPTILVNGKQGLRSDSPPAFIPLNMAEKNLRDPFVRIISNGFLFCPIQTYVEGYEFRILSADGLILDRPMIADVLTIFPGERYDVELVRKPNSTSSSMYSRRLKSKLNKKSPIMRADAMHWIGMGDCEHEDFNANATSYIIHYSKRDNVTNEPVGLTIEDIVPAMQLLINIDFKKSHWTSMLKTARIFNPVHKEDFTINNDHLRITNLKPSRNLAKAIQRVDHKIFLFTDSYLIDEDIPMFNNISFRHPSAPLLSQYYDVPDRELCNINTHPQCASEFCSCTHMYEIELGAVVEVIVIDEGLNGEYDIHSIHLHGYSFAVLAQEKIGNNVSVHQIKEMDSQGRLTRNLADPIIKDSVAIPEGGYVIIRFIADNPGFWMLHCHLDFHFLKGMALIFKVGDVKEMPEIPPKFPHCGSWFTDPINTSPNRWKIFKP
ncbi:unnamed protein product [Gordionus sp. m RMFG-2023]